MANGERARSVTIRRTAPGSFVARNVRGGEVTFGSGNDTDFTPVELLLAAIGGCTGIDVDVITGRRAAPESFELTVTATSVRGEQGNHLEDVSVVFDLVFPSGDAGDAARAVLPDAVRRSHDRLCTVSRTVELPTPVSMSVAGAA